MVQPHRYTRLPRCSNEFCTCFNDADAVIVADVYAAGEAPIEGVNRDALVDGLRAARPSRRGRRSPAPADLAGMVCAIARPGDVVVCLGAGNITAWAHALPGELAALQAAAGRRGSGGMMALATSHPHLIDRLPGRAAG